ncbi:hypothetical protein [Sinorhizobium meliloti]|uniref:hypothetical protein n=1 Tax=Rhizobium meliloti TaxID=382 RepID=UPI0012971DB9|nr:hypothetical protein [Sinorhizobium meliloti]MQU83325.1 hypothetical protein [Sinorhizobium meliloti]
MSTPYGINRVGNMIAPFGVETRTPEGRWVRAVPEPYSSSLRERLRAAWWVSTGKAEAVVWPAAGELEAALREDRP